MIELLLFEGHFGLLCDMHPYDYVELMRHICTEAVKREFILQEAKCKMKRALYRFMEVTNSLLSLTDEADDDATMRPRLNAYLKADLTSAYLDAAQEESKPRIAIKTHSPSPPQNPQTPNPHTDKQT